MAKKVAIIGAGSSGLCSGKYALENNLEPTLFEKSDIMSDDILNLSKALSCDCEVNEIKEQK